ncbi:hypothetical protein DEJ49_33585 [Streptomyces venezuelae]|uniref:Transglycosylase SLT domain-containing protein n=1 Tax=Streptomyces venezuelae TaxID=54571 RepID=A0A5P2CS82_STRVZ|nr:hypothetical protein [Streptomyces venezuelae]QES45273.1 hypothetical protein DEJ49_33585 [Streptomyces venezuelae]
MATITSLSFVITSTYDGAGMRRARRDMDGFGSSTRSLHSILTPFNSQLKIMSARAIALAPALLPVATAVGALAGGIAAASTAAGAAAGIFGGALVGALKSVSAQVKGPTDALERQKATLAGMKPGTAAYREQLKKVAEAQKVLNQTIAGLSEPARKYIKSEREMKSAWGDFIQATEKDTLTPVSIAMDAVSRNMGKFVPIVKAVSPLVTKLAQDFADWMDGEGLDTFIDLVLKYGVPALKDFIRIGRNVVSALGDGFRDFLPLGVKVVKALADGSQELKEWAAEGGFERFVNKFLDSAPELKSICKDLVVILGSLGVAVESTSEESVTVLGILADLLSLLSPELITAITYAWLGWNLALEAYALYCTAAAAASVLLATATSPFFLLIAGAALTVLAVVAALAALAAGIYFLVKYWDNVTAAFKTAWNATWNAIKIAALVVWDALKVAWAATWVAIQAAARVAWDFLTQGWGQFCLLLLGPLGVLAFIALHWAEIWGWIKESASTVWSALQAGWAGFLGGLSTAWNSVWGALTTAWQGFIGPFMEMWNTVWPQVQLAARNIWTGLSMAWSALWKSILFVWNLFWGEFGGSFTGGWNALWVTVLGIWNIFYATFSALFSSAWQGLTAAASAAWKAMTAAWQFVWTTMVSVYQVGWAILSGAWQTGWAWLTGAAQIAWSVMTGAWKVIWATVTGIWNTFYATFSAVFSSAWNVLVTIATGIWNVVKAAWQALWATVTAIFLTFTAVFTGNWGMAWNAIKDAGVAIWNVIKVAWQGFLNVLVAYFNAFVSIFTAAFRAAWTAIQNIATTAWNAFKASFQVFLTALQNLWNTAWTAIRNIFQTVVNAIVAIAQAGWNLLRAGMQAFLTAVTAIWNTAWTTIRTFFQTTATGIAAAATSLWDKMREIFSAGSTWLRNTFWNPVHDFFTKTIPNAFDSAVKAIGKAWDGLRKMIFTPVQAIVDVVYNRGIVKLWNIVAKVFSAKELSEFHLPGFAKGGPVDGPGSGTSDSIVARLSAGEHVWTAKEVAGAGGHEAVAALRSQAMGGAKVRAFGDAEHRFDDGGGVLGTPWGPDWGPDLVPNGIIKNALKVLKDVVLGGVYGVIKPPINAAVGAAQTAVRKIIPGDDSGLEQLATGIPRKMGDTVLDWIKEMDVAPVSGGGFIPWAKWKDGDGEKVTYGGVVVNKRTAAMLKNASKLARTAFTMFQGSYSNSVGQSAGTHAGGGAVDLGPAKDSIVGAMRASGFAAWRRTPAEGFSPHIHGIAVGDPTVSPQAAQQVKDFQAGLNGLANKGPDTYKGGTVTGGKSPAAAQAIAKSMLGAYNWSTHWSALKALWTRESGWRWNADNPTSDAYGIPQALPGSKMRSAGADWKTNPATQIKWGLGYIKDRYGTPTRANDFQKAHNWYGLGTPGASRGPAVVGESGPEFMNLRGGERIDTLRDLVGRGGGDVNVEVNIPITGRADHGVVDRLERETIPQLTMAIKQGVGRRP